MPSIQSIITDANHEMVKAAFLDRDGVIVKTVLRDGKECAPRTMEEFEILPDAWEATLVLMRKGYQVFVVTNQPDIGNGFIERTILNRMHKKLVGELFITKIYTCAHRQNAGCDCRKPKVGLLVKARSQFNIDMKNSIMIGDQESDLEAGIAAGCGEVRKVIPSEVNLLEVVNVFLQSRDKV